MIKPTWSCPRCGRSFWYGPAARVATDNPCTGQYNNATRRFEEHPPIELEPIRQEDV